MADSNSRLFVPPMNRVPEKDSMQVIVPFDVMPHGARKSQTGKEWKNGSMSVSHVPNKN